VFSKFAASGCRATTFVAHLADQTHYGDSLMIFDIGTTMQTVKIVCLLPAERLVEFAGL
jgi:hypothetical protein